MGGWVYPCKLLREPTSRGEEVGSISALDVFKNRAPIVVLSQQQKRLLLLLLLLLLLPGACNLDRLQRAR